MWEIDLRSCRTGNSVETICSTESYDEANEYLNMWYKEHSSFDIDKDRESLIDGTNRVFADIYQTDWPHGIGKW